MFDEWAEEGTGTLLDRYASTQTPSIMRFTLFSFEEGFPRVLAMDGFCLDPLDRGDGRSALDWLLYGIHEKEQYPFRHLAGSAFSGYANYIEGGEPLPAEKFLKDLDQRLDSSQVSCEGYEASDRTIRVWTSGWSPDWQMTQLCYVGCETLDPPYESDFAGFFLYNIGGAWSLVVNYVNDPQNYYFSPYELIPCDQPERLDVVSSQPGFTSAPLTEEAAAPSSCPGAPPQRLKIDEMAFVCTAGDTVKLREGPGRSYSILKSLDPGTELKVIGGP